MGAQEAHEEARNLIEHVLKIGGINLWLENSDDLEDVPHVIGRLTSLARLNVRNNPRLHALPGAIRHLQELVTMDVSNCAVEMLPEEITTLASLRELKLSGNRISRLPDGFETMTSLRSLRIDGNKFEWFPAACMDLFRRLAVLDVQGNPLFTPTETSYSDEIANIETYPGDCKCGEPLPFHAVKYVHYVLPTGDGVVGTDTLDADGERRPIGTRGWTPQAYDGDVLLPVRRRHIPYLSLLCSPECASRLYANEMVRHTVPAFHSLEQGRRAPQRWDLA